MLYRRALSAAEIAKLYAGALTNPAIVSRRRRVRYRPAPQQTQQAGSSVVERGLYTARVAGSIPVPPTIPVSTLR